MGFQKTATQTDPLAGIVLPRRDAGLRRAVSKPNVLEGTTDALRHIHHTTPSINLFATNPCILTASPQTYLLRLTAYSACGVTPMSTLIRHRYEDNSITAFMRRGRPQPLAVFNHSEDARGIVVPNGRRRGRSAVVWIVYSSFSSASGANWMELRRFTWPSLAPLGRPIALSYARRSRREKNWIPFASEGRVYLTYSVEPHVVLRCRTATGACEELHRTSNAQLWRRRIHAGHHGLSGGTPCVALGGMQLCVAHYRWPAGTMRVNGVKYWHVMYALANAAPFAVVNVSRPFRFGALFGEPQGRDRTQYAAGLVVDARRQVLTISYGVGDCVAAAVDVAVADAMRMLTGDAGSLPAQLSASAKPAAVAAPFSSTAITTSAVATSAITPSALATTSITPAAIAASALAPAVASSALTASSVMLKALAPLGCIVRWFSNVTNDGRSCSPTGPDSEIMNGS